MGSFIDSKNAPAGCLLWVISMDMLGNEALLFFRACSFGHQRRREREGYSVVCKERQNRRLQRPDIQVNLRPPSPESYFPDHMSKTDWQHQVFIVANSMFSHCWYGIVVNRIQVLVVVVDGFWLHPAVVEESDEDLDSAAGRGTEVPYLILNASSSPSSTTATADPRWGRDKPLHIFSLWEKYVIHSLWHTASWWLTIDSIDISGMQGPWISHTYITSPTKASIPLYWPVLILSHNWLWNRKGTEIGLPH